MCKYFCILVTIIVKNRKSNQEYYTMKNKYFCGSKIESKGAPLLLQVLGVGDGEVEAVLNGQMREYETGQDAVAFYPKTQTKKTKSPTSEGNKLTFRLSRTWALEIGVY